MSHSYRTPVGAQPTAPVASTPLSGRMVAPICTTGSPAVYPVMPNAYGLLTQQPQQYIPQPVIYPQPLTNVQNPGPFIPGVPSNVPRLFVPVAPIAPGISPSSSDPTKLLEEQRRLEKERNFQLQQERLKQFTVSGKKPNINPDNLIDSMFGKLEPKKPSGVPSSAASSTIIEKHEEKRTESITFEEKSKNEIPVNKSDIGISTFVGTPTNVTASFKKDMKGLESMMLECSNLNNPVKASKFQKQTVRDIAPSSNQSTTFKPSEKAIDWRNLKGLDEVFSAPKPRFPSWCYSEKVPELYKKIQAIVTNNGMHAPETSLLFPILVSSGLSRELLGQIWELVNESAPGQLSVEEIYAALALIAVAQSGHPVKSVAILHQVPMCPVPQLSCFTNVTVSQDQNNAILSSVSDENLVAEQPKQPVHQVVRPTAIALNQMQSSVDYKEITDVSQNLSSWTPFAGQGENFTTSSNAADDDFDDFQSATPTAVNFSFNTPTQVLPAFDDDFDDFKQAPCINSSESSALASVQLPKTSEIDKKQNEPIAQDLMSPEEDKYSVFRDLQQIQDTNQWRDFTVPSVSTDLSNTLPIGKETSVMENASSVKQLSVSKIENLQNNGLFKADFTQGPVSQEDDEFGDFVHATVPAAPTTTVTDFADFSNFKEPESDQQPDDEFGEFTSSVPISLKPDIGHEYLFHHLKDNISLAESQSVSSLELGTFDGGGGHSGESKSSLSRQGSIPSLDLKSTGLDGTDTEDCFSEIQLSSFVPHNSKSPSPVSNKVSEENEISTVPVGQLFQPSTLPLTDKYSVIRQEKAKEEDQHVSSWIRCLQSAVDILQSTKKIFNQMSCSSVCNEVLSSEEGRNYVKNVTEVYKLICRIGLVSKSSGKQTEAIIDLLNEAEQAWNTVCGFLAGSALLPEESSMDFSSGILRPEPENNTKACGLCLLNIDLRSKSFKDEECPKLSYGGRNYHSTCANFWVNCVDPLLPALTLPQLL